MHERLRDLTRRLDLSGPEQRDAARRERERRAAEEGEPVKRTGFEAA